MDAESFAYIFASPNGEHQQDPLAKVKTAMLLMAYHFYSTRASPVYDSFLLNQCVI